MDRKSAFNYTRAKCSLPNGLAAMDEERGQTIFGVEANCLIKISTTFEEARAVVRVGRCGPCELN